MKVYWQEKLAEKEGTILWGVMNWIFGPSPPPLNTGHMDTHTTTTTEGKGITTREGNNLSYINLILKTPCFLRWQRLSSHSCGVIGADSIPHLLPASRIIDSTTYLRSGCGELRLTQWMQRISLLLIARFFELYILRI